MHRLTPDAIAFASSAALPALRSRTPHATGMRPPLDQDTGDVAQASARVSRPAY